MTTLRILETAVISGVVFAAIDFVWLSFIAKKFYYKELGSLLLTKPLLPPAVLFYALYIVGMLFFVIVPALDKSSASDALLAGALFGLFTYSTYDLTNLATLKGWSRKVTAADMLWGTFVTATTSVITYLILRQL